MLVELLVGFSLAGAPSSASQPPFVIDPCELKANPEAPREPFAASVAYAVTTDAAGAVTSVVVDDDVRATPPALRPTLESVERCLKTWKLEPDTEYVAVVKWGYSRPVWQVCRTRGGCSPVLDGRLTAMPPD